MTTESQYTDTEIDRRNSSIIEQDFLNKKILHEEVKVDIKVYSYAPKVFKFLRALDNIDEIDIMRSVKPQMNKM
jgi:hypothetical protein